MWAWLVQRVAAVALLGGDRAAPAQSRSGARCRRPCSRSCSSTACSACAPSCSTSACRCAGIGSLLVLARWRWRRGLRGVLGVAMVLKVFRWSPGFRERLQRFWVPAKAGHDGARRAGRRRSAGSTRRSPSATPAASACAARAAMVINGRERWACRTLLKSLKTAHRDRPPALPFPADPRPGGRHGAARRADRARRRRLRARREEPAAFAPIGARRAGAARASTPRSSASAAACACRPAPWWPTTRASRGPAALNRLFTLASATAATRAMPTARRCCCREDTLTRCHSQANCTDVCPMEISPTESILALRRRAVRGLIG